MATNTDNAINATGVRDERSRPSTAIIILAAGASTRMGRPKQLLTYDGHTFLRKAAEAAAASVCRPLLVVLGAYADQLHSEIYDLPTHQVVNTRWAEGMGSSIRAGMEALDLCDRKSVTDAVVLMLCDQPFVTAAVINNLVTAFRANSKGIVASEYSGTVGVPALFGSEYFAALASLNSAAGAKQIITAHASDVMRVPFPQGTTDVDTPEDYLRLQRRVLSQAPYANYPRPADPTIIERRYRLEHAPMVLEKIPSLKKFLASPGKRHDK